MKDSGDRADSSFTIRFGKVLGIPIKIHLTFFLFLLWVGLQSRGHDAVGEVVFVASIFACVLLHELGHAFAAARFSIRTRDIVLYPFGGVASIAGDAKPKAELVIAAAGPLVNVIILFALIPFIGFTDQGFSLVHLNFAGRLAIANLMLILFNLIPAFPMDGGRIFRSALALMEVEHATLIATKTSQFISLVLGVLALYSGHFLLLVVACLVFMNAMQEQVHDKARRAAMGLKVRDVMTSASSLEIFNHGMTVSQALKVVLKSLQEIFPVLYNDTLMGIIDKNTIIEAAAGPADEGYITGLLIKDYLVVHPSDSLVDVIERLPSLGLPAFVVLDGDTFVGLLLKEKMLEFLVVQELRARNRRGQDFVDEDV